MPRSDGGNRAVDLLRQLVSIPSVTGSEADVMDFVEGHFRQIGWSARSIPVSPDRRNLLIHRGDPRVVLTSHADTVPEHFTSRDEGGFLHARGACDAKGSLAAMAVALESLSAQTDEVGLLVLVGEEKGSDGALAANRDAPTAVRFLVGGEPTGSRFVRGSKGCLRVRVETCGAAGHSSVPHARPSAIDLLLDVLNDLRGAEFAAHPLFGPTTMNIGVLEGGSAPNVVAEGAQAEILFRTGHPVARLLGRVAHIIGDRAHIVVAYRSDPIFFRVPRDVDGELVQFACDLPLLTAWGEPLLVGPGAIEDAHSADEKVKLSEIGSAVEIYVKLARALLEQGEEFLKPRESGT